LHLVGWFIWIYDDARTYKPYIVNFYLLAPPNMETYRQLETDVAR
jgi:hypothetical protein